MNDNKKKKPLVYYYAFVAIVLVLLNLVLRPVLQQAQIEEVPYSTFIQQTTDDKIDEVTIESSQITYKLKDGDTVYSTVKINDPDLVDRLESHDVKFSGTRVQQGSLFMNIFFGWILPIIIAVMLMRYVNRTMQGGGKDSPLGGGGLGGMFNLGKSNARVYDKDKTTIRFHDVAGEDEAKENLQEIVNYLHDPNQFKSIGATMPKGILLVGPPGTGKTMLAKAVAGESNVPFFSISGSEFVEMFVGMGASKVRSLFKDAKEKAPCIVFIDEIDAIGGKRNAGNFGGNDEREQT